MSDIWIRETYRVMAEFGWNPRDLDECTLPELCRAHGMVPVLRRERLRDHAIAVRMSKMKEQDWKKALRELG